MDLTGSGGLDQRHATADPVPRRTPSNHGFSLIEVLLVIVVLGILGTVVVLAVSGITSEAESSACAADRQLLEKASESFFADRQTNLIPDSGAEDGFEQTLIEEGFLRRLSTNYDLDGNGQLTPDTGSECS